MSRYSDTILATSGLVSYWRLSESSGSTAVDQKGVNTGTYTGNVVKGIGGATSDDADRAVALTGENGTYVLAKAGGILAGSVNFTIEAWVRRGADPRFDKAIYCERGAAGNDILKLQLLTGSSPTCKLQFVYRNDAGSLVFDPTSTIGISDGNWHHIVLTKLGTTGHIHIDGAERSNAGSITPADTFTDTLSSRIGGDAQDGNAYLEGSIDEVAVYNVALSAVTIAAHWRASQPESAYASLILSEAGLVSYWRLADQTTAAGSFTIVDQMGATPAGLNKMGAFRQNGALYAEPSYAMSFTGDAVGGTGSALDLGASPAGFPVAGTSRTIEMWYKGDAGVPPLGTAALLFYGNSTLNGAVDVAIDGGTNQLRIYNGTSSVFVGDNVRNGRWRHIVLSYNGTTWTGILDGVEIAQAQTLNTVFNFTSYIGNDGGFFFNHSAQGLIQDVAIYNVALTGTQARRHFNLGRFIPARASRYANAVFADHPVAYWRLDEPNANTTTIVDIAGTNNALPFNGASQAGWSPSSRAGAITDDPDTAMTFASFGLYAVVQHASAISLAQNFSVEAWVLPANVAKGTVISKSTGMWKLVIDVDAKVYLSKPTVADEAVSSVTASLGAWHHIVATYATSANSSFIYLDGVDVTTHPGAGATFTTNTSKLQIGSYDGGVPDAFGDTLGTGSGLDELALYNYVLTATQVTAHYQAGKNGPP